MSILIAEHGSRLWNSFSVLQTLFSNLWLSPSVPLHAIPQYIYETNENGDKVVLGKGTYGVVYAGRDLSNQVRIAIKEIPEKDSTYEQNI